MDPFTIAMLGSAAIAGGTSLAGGIMANDAREAQAEQANKYGLWMQREGQQFNAEVLNQQQRWNVENWQRNAEWLSDMSNTAYRRARIDMLNAGLNPILALRQGQASTPASSAPQAGALGSPGFTPGAKADVENFLGGAAGSALRAAETVAGVQQTLATVDQTQANTNLLAQETALRKDQQELARANTAESVARTLTEGHRAGLVSAQAATEAMNPALRSAETAAQNALAGERSESTVGLRLENERTRNYGPRSSAADALANTEAIARRAANSGATRPFLEGMDRIMQGIAAGQSGYSGPRRIPSGPARPSSGYDPYGLMAR